MSTIIRFFSRIYVFIFNKFKDFGSLLINNSYFSLYKFYSNNTKVINIILYTFVGIISYFFLYDLTSIKVIKIFIFTLISLAVSMYILDNYTFSNNIFIKILQKLVFLILKLSLIVFIFEIFDFSLFNNIHCEPTDVDNNDASNNKKETKKYFKPTVELFMFILL